WKFSFGENFVKASNEEISVISRLSENKFCGYEVLLKKDITFDLTADRAEMIKGLSLAAVAASRSTSLCAINFNGSKINIVSQDVDFGKEGSSSVKVKHSVEIDAIGVNS